MENKNYDFLKIIFKYSELYLSEANNYKINGVLEGYP